MCRKTREFKFFDLLCRPTGDNELLVEFLARQATQAMRPSWNSSAPAFDDATIEVYWLNRVTPMVRVILDWHDCVACSRCNVPVPVIDPENQTKPVWCLSCYTENLGGETA